MRPAPRGIIGGHKSRPVTGPQLASFTLHQSSARRVSVAATPAAKMDKAVLLDRVRGALWGE